MYDKKNRLSYYFTKNSKKMRAKFNPLSDSQWQYIEKIIDKRRKCIHSFPSGWSEYQPLGKLATKDLIIASIIAFVAFFCFLIGR